MSSTLGEKLRQAREERGISISEVAEQTRISSLYLKSIEDDNYKPLPGCIFNKGFVRSYAKYVGLDEQEALQDYARLIAKNEDVAEVEQPRYRPEVLTDDARTASSMVPTIVFAGIILALMTGGILFVVNYIQNQPDGPAVANNSSTNSATVATNTDASNTATSTTPPTPDQIRVEFRALSEKVSVTSTVDGTLAYDEVLPEAPKTYTAQEGVKLRYYRGFADKVQITLNGKQLVAPPAPAKGNIEFEINKENVARIIESGTIVDAAPAAAATPATTPQATPAASSAATPAPAAANTSARPSPTPPRPAFTPQPTPRRSPTPIVVGRPPASRPSPE
jgi:cytoskeletal protein RodZ